jgi:hypothetical protein
MSETDPLTGSAKKRPLEIQIEYYRCFGLAAGMVMLLVGKTVSDWFNEYPVTDEPLNSWWDIATGKADSNFHPKETYIQHLFSFIHTCVYIDNNPAKTCAALLIQIAMFPLILFCILNYQRIQLQEGPEFDTLKKHSFKVVVFEVFCCSYFFLCLVNSPIQDPKLFDTWRAKRQFILHYVPYMLFQVFEIVLSLEQILFLRAKDKLLFSWMTKGVLKAYFYFSICLYIVYCTFIWSHIIGGAGNGLWDSSTPMGNIATNTIMWSFNAVGAIIPAIFAYFDAGNVAPVIIEFSMGATPP